MMETQIVIGVPGLWKDRTELIQEVVSKSNYILAEMLCTIRRKRLALKLIYMNKRIHFIIRVGYGS